MQGIWGRSDDNMDFADLPESVKQCIYEKAGEDTNVLQELNACSLERGGTNCVRKISELKSCFE